MNVANASLLSTLFGLTAFVTGLALLVQVFQELYKYVTSSKARSYRKVLEDLSGPWIREVIRSDLMSDLTLRSPFQLWRWSPTGLVLPMEPDILAKAAERAAPPWARRTLAALELEAELQTTGASQPSPAWRAFLEDLWSADKGSPGFLTAQQIQKTLGQWRAVSVKEGEEDRPLIEALNFDAEWLLTTFHRELLPHVAHLREYSDQIATNFEYSYRRRNLRQTFTFALILAICCNLPFDKLYRRASAMPIDQAVAAAEKALAISGAEASIQELPTVPSPAPAASLDETDDEETETRAPGTASEPSQTVDDVAARSAEAKDLLAAAFDGGEDNSPVNYLIDRAYVVYLVTHPWPGLRYLFGCFFTALLVVFGAPLLNDVAGFALRARKSATKQGQGT